jgi:hypothetical protein
MNENSLNFPLGALFFKLNSLWRFFFFKKSTSNIYKNQHNRDSSKGYGISPGPNYQGLGDRDRGRSRSRSRGKDGSDRTADIANLKALHKDHGFDMLKSPKEAESKLRASSPSTSLREYQKIEGESRPQTKLIYGIARKPGVAEGRIPVNTNQPSRSQEGQSREGNGGSPSEAK